jgi:hypothetical protein
MIHELSHVMCSTGMAGILSYDRDTSDANAVRGENAYRRVVGFCDSPSHGVWPAWDDADEV